MNVRTVLFVTPALVSTLVGGRSAVAQEWSDHGFGVAAGDEAVLSWEPVERQCWLNGVGWWDAVADSQDWPSHSGNGRFSVGGAFLAAVSDNQGVGPPVISSVRERYGVGREHRVVVTQSIQNHGAYWPVEDLPLVSVWVRRCGPGIATRLDAISDLRPKALRAAVVGVLSNGWLVAQDGDLPEGRTLHGVLDAAERCVKRGRCTEWWSALTVSVGDQHAETPN